MQSVDRALPLLAVPVSARQRPMTKKRTSSNDTFCGKEKETQEASPGIRLLIIKPPNPLAQLLCCLPPGPPPAHPSSALRIQAGAGDMLRVLPPWPCR